MSRFDVIIPLRKTGVNDNALTGIASTTSVDRDDERMSAEALSMMVADIKRTGVNLFGNHSHEWENTLGVIKDARVEGNQVVVDVTLDDASTNPKIPALLNKLNRGIMLGLSVGGNVTNFKWEYDKELGKKIKVLDKVHIYEVSVVGIPSNADSYLSMGAAIAKSAKTHLSKCPLCYSTEQDKGACTICRLPTSEWE